MTDPIQMPDAMQPVRPASALSAASAAKPGSAAEGKDFRTILLDSLDEVNRLQQEADEGVQRLLTGETNNVAEVMHAVNKAGIAFDLLMEIRNKLTEAYRDIKQMQI